ncbi:hypothetical protein [Streptomyces gilvus]|uniref:hypothetical protein n=1 Tax=Streptomyces gilvus TaxID=2920937 RepID=UPI0027E5AF7B|nr:hypothetical protein [Streptomyces sp. CME 23]
MGAGRDFDGQDIGWGVGARSGGPGFEGAYADDPGGEFLGGRREFGARDDQLGDLESDDELAVLLRPPAEYLGPPPGRYEAIRRGASRRRLLRAAAGAALTVGVAALVILPLRLTASHTPSSPAVPMAPPPVSSPSAPPSSRTPPPEPSASAPGRDRRTLAPSEPPADRASPSIAPSAATRTQLPSARPSKTPGDVRPTPTIASSAAEGR